MDGNSLRSKFEALQQESTSIHQEALDIISGVDNLANESLRVANVARNSNQIMHEVEQDFASSTSITNPTDMAFLGVAIALQTVRWIILNKLTERGSAGSSDFEKWVKGKYKGYNQTLPTPYYAPYSYIVGHPTVPYDATRASGYIDNAGLKISGHRNRTLGHDPILGFIFGTSNILTSTLTNNLFQTFHVLPKGNLVVQPASTLTMFSKVAERIANEPKALGAAVIKHSLHIATDIYTKEGIPLPFIQTLSSDTADFLGQYGIDTGGLLKAVASAKTASLIDSLISATHGLYFDGTQCTRSQYEVRTKKILAVSSSIAQGSNILKTAVTGNILDLDFGGLVYTLHRLIKDIDFITEIKKEYMGSSFNKIIMGDR